MGLGRTFRMASVGVAIAGMAAFVLPSATAYGATINVAPGHSIQNAVNHRHSFTNLLQDFHVGLTGGANITLPVFFRVKARN